MSNLIPKQVVDSIRAAVDTILQYYGIDCTLYVPSTQSFNQAEKLDAYLLAESDLQFTKYITKVFLDFKPNIYRLRKLGLYTEGTLPITARFGRKATPDGSDTPVDVDIVQRSYFVISTEHLTGVTDTTEFEVLDTVPLEFHDAIMWQEVLVGPRRVKR